MSEAPSSSGDLEVDAEGPTAVAQWLDSLSLSDKTRHSALRLLEREGVVSLDLVAELGAEIQEREAFKALPLVARRALATAVEGLALERGLAWPKQRALEEARGRGLCEDHVDGPILRTSPGKGAVKVAATPLRIAASRGDADAVLLLLRAGADVMQTGPVGNSCLHYAALSKDLKVVKHLLAKGGRQLLMLTNKDGFSCLQDAAMYGNLEVVKHLVAEGGRELLMLTNKSGISCLHNAAANGYLEVVKHLAERGGWQLVDLSDSYGKTAHDIALWKGHTDVADFLEAF